MSAEPDQQLIQKLGNSLARHSAVSRETWAAIDMEEDANSPRWLAFKSRSDLRALSRNSEPQEG